MHPRRARLGLIEAENAMQQSVIDPMHPRRARLGLIEARPFLAALSFARVCIRGARASASLKRRSLELLGIQSGVHPRRARLGLIAARPLVGGAGGGVEQPRRARRGLIEATRRLLCGLASGRIRGARASASLKPRLRSRYPLLDCRASEARAPRPHGSPHSARAKANSPAKAPLARPRPS